MSNAENRDLKLTLRTLLAWLDDQLSPSDVRQIGQKVAESQVAQSLIEKIRKVTRRRRLTVPSASGPDGTDPNLVASYLDNQLPADKVAEYEEKCLRSDLDLAEVASCHQILSMISQRAKVPPAARFRMYRLVKGREAIARDHGRGASTAAAEPTAKPVPVWTPPGGTHQRSAFERYGPVAAALLLMALMGISARMMIPATEDLEIVGTPPSIPIEVALAPGAGGLAGATARPGSEFPVDQGDLATTDVLPGSIDLLATDEDATPEAAPTSIQPSLGRVDDLEDGILLRWSAEERSWLPMKAGDTLASDDRIIAPPPFRPALQVGTARVRLIGPTAVRLLQPEAGESTRLALEDGRLILHADSPATAAIVVESEAVRIDLPAGTHVGAERVANWPAGAEIPAVSSLTISVASSEVGLRAGAIEETLAGPGSVTYRGADAFADPIEGNVPDWLTGAAPGDVELLTGSEFAAYFTPNATTTRALVESVEDETAAVRRFGVATLGLLGSVDLVAAVLTRSEESSTRLSAIRALRDYGARSPAAALDLREKLAQFNGETWAALVFELLAGTSTVQAGQRQTYVELVALLEHPDLGVRSLALDELMILTGRDSLQYDPARPMGSGLAAWQMLLRSGEIQPRRPLEAAEEEPGPPGERPSATPPSGR